MNPVGPKKARSYIEKVMRAGLVPMVSSSPGLGKSSIAKQIAEKENLKLIDVRLSQCDPADLLGFPAIEKEAGKAGYLPMNTFPIEGDELPTKPNGEKYKGWFLLLDEFSSAPLSVQAAAYKIVLDRQVGMHDLHKKVVIMAAGNRSTDKAIVNRMGTAMQSRLVHINLQVNNEEWYEWAEANGVDHRVVSYLRFKPELLDDFKPDHDDLTFPCPRTWEFASKIIKKEPVVDRDLQGLLEGTIGEGAALEFATYCEIYKKLPTIDQMINKPASVDPTDFEPTVNFAISGMISNNFTEETATPLMEIVNKLALEFQLISLKGAIRNNTSLLNIPEVEAWVNKNAKNLI